MRHGMDVAARRRHEKDVVALDASLAGRAVADERDPKRPREGTGRIAGITFPKSDSPMPESDGRSQPAPTACSAGASSNFARQPAEQK